MPTTFYTEGEYNLLKRERDELERRVSALEDIRPVWAQGWGDAGDLARSNALATLWQMLGASNQTEAVRKLQALLARNQSTEEFLKRALASARIAARNWDHRG